jgi:ribosomal protein L12E/L44/L45/RPP1/RPP2
MHEPTTTLNAWLAAATAADDFAAGEAPTSGDQRATEASDSQAEEDVGKQAFAL